jgi:UDP-glucuronate 4-epimerase
VEGVVRVMHKPPSSEGADLVDQAPYKLYNIGNNKPVTLRKFIEVIEAATGKEAQKNYLPMQPGDVPITYADVDELMQDVGFKPSTSIEEGIGRFVEWYRSYYSSKK